MNKAIVQNSGRPWDALTYEELIGRIELSLTIMKVMERVCRELKDAREANAYAHCYDILSTGKAIKTAEPNLNNQQAGSK
jgi:hypothetical protein